MISKSIKWVLTAGIILIIAAIVLYMTYVISVEIFTAVIAGILLNMVNSSAAFYLFDRSYKKDNQKFLIYNLGGMGARILFLLAGILILLNFLKISVYAFILVFFIFYFILLAVEINYFRIKVESRRRK